MTAPERIRAAIEAGRREGERYAIAIPRLPASGAAGIHLGARLGSSLEFLEHREYQPGDDLRHVDWSASARGDRPLVKLHRDEVSPRLDIVLDGSRSMALPGSAKEAAAVGMCALLATAAQAASLSCDTWLATDGGGPLPGGPLRPESWGAEPFRGVHALGRALLARPPRLGPRSIRVLVSDLLFPEEPGPLLGRLASGAASLSVLRIAAREDLAPAARGSLKVIDVETGEEVELAVDDATAAAYGARLHAHHEAWRDAARARGAALSSFVAEELVAAWDVRPLLASGLLR